jgi:glycine oxidase
MTEHRDVLVVGGGVIGLWIAFRSAQAGATVTVVDPAPGRGASWTAAGMLAPVTEYGYGEDALLRLNLAAAAGYPAAVSDLTQAAGMELGYRVCGAIEVAWDSADLAGLRQLDARRASLGLATRLLDRREVRRLEPGLAPGLPGGVLAVDDHQVDPRRMTAALVRALEASGVRFVQATVTELEQTAGRVTGVATDRGGRLSAAAVVLAAGAASGRLPGLAPAVQVPVRPVKGQTLRLRSREPVLERMVRGRVRGVPVYIVPRADGEVVVGASSEEAGFDDQPRTGAVHDLLRDATLVVPGLAETEWVEVSTGLRPGTPDNGPVVGWTAVEGLLVATGHYRNGVLLAPLTASAVATLLGGGPMCAEFAPFGPDRFEASELVGHH